MHTFLVCGLPRSRLSWLARFLSVPHVSVCLCDGLNRTTSAEKYWSLFEELCWFKGISYFGNAEVLNLAVLPALLAARPLTKVVWIDRDLSQSIRSAAAAGCKFDPALWQGLAELRDRYAQHFDLVLPFAELGEEDAIRLLWQTVLPGLPFDRRRWKAFADKRIVCSREEKARGRDLRRLEQFLEVEGETIIVPPR